MRPNRGRLVAGAAVAAAAAADDDDDDDDDGAAYLIVALGPLTQGRSREEWRGKDRGGADGREN